MTCRRCLAVVVLLAVSVQGVSVAGEILDKIPDSFFASSGPSYGLAAGDVDFDGDLDVFFANKSVEAGQNTLFLNRTGAFGDEAVRLTPIPRYSRDVATGDLDGDGDLDLVVANEETFFNTVFFFGEGGYAEGTWKVGYDDDSRAVALGDFDRDGYLDVAFANKGGRNTIYPGGADGPGEDPVWRSAEASQTIGLAWGDVDGNGWVDLVCANGGQPNTVYLNSAAGLDTLPSFLLGSTEYTNDLALGDLDGDGDLDVVFANSFTEKQNTIHLNTGTGFLPVWDWQFGESFETQAVDLGDVDGDGDLDIVFGNRNQQNNLYLNDGGTTWGTPAWFSGEDNSTEDVFLADVTGDGWLDLLEANSTDDNKIYRNTWGPFDRRNMWSNAPTGPARAMAIADVDGDGDQDLAVGYGSADAADEIYLNDGGTFGSAPVWTGSEVAFTRSLAWGDIDGNGVLDLVCGNYSTAQTDGWANVLYLNPGAGGGTDPAWRSGPAYSTRSVALGDVDRDGDLDLVCGNEIDPGTLYLNDRGVFGTSPAWSSRDSLNTEGVALADLDRDGWLDLVCGNGSGVGNCVFMNRGGTFPDVPDWVYDDVSVTRVVEIADLDGDGWLDVIFGNESQTNAVHFNRDGVLGSHVAFGRGDDQTYALDTGDLDGDGDLDVVCGNLFDADVVYRNDGGVLSADPMWESPDAGATRGLALADLDRDGDTDLVAIKVYEPAAVLLGRSEPTYPSDPGNPTNQGTAFPAYVRDVTVTPAGENSYDVSFTVVDLESDPVWLVAEYGFTGDPAWYPADLGGGGALIGPLASSPTGVPHQAVWEVSLAVIDARPATLRLRSVSVPRRVSAIREIPPFLLDVGPLAVRRPEILALPGSLDFGIVTVGDTATVDLEIRNTGTENLVFEGVSFPHAEFLFTPDPVSVPPIPPGGSASLEVSMIPRTELATGGDLEVLSTDPLTRRYPVPMDADVKALDFESRLLSPAEEAPLGEAITVIVTPGRDVRVEGGFLFHRQVGATGFEDSIPLVTSDADFIAVIPGASVTELGLEYYIRVENSGVFAADPVGAPDAGVLVQAVTAPALLVTTAPANSSLGHLAGQSIRVEGHLPAGSVFDSGTLFFRQGGEQEFSQVELAMDAGVPAAVIPDSVVGPRGIEYWMEVATRTTTLMDPPAGEDARPIPLTTAITDLVEPEVIPARTYRMIGIPLVLQDEFTGTIEAMLFDQPGFGSYDPVQWRCFRYSPVDGRYLEHAKAVEEFRPEPGRAYWLISHAESRLTTEPVSGFSTPTNAAWEVALAPGWNQVGHPFAFPVDWAMATLDGVPVGDAVANLSLEAPVGWDWENQEYRPGIEMLESFGGYWIRNLGTVDAVLAIPPVAHAPKATQSREVPEGPNWRLVVSAASGEVSGTTLIAGVHEAASPDRDPFDVSLPPGQPGRSLTLSFPHGNWVVGPGDYQWDYRPVESLIGSKGLGMGATWDMALAKNWADEGVADVVTVTVEGVAGVPDEFQVRLMDRVTGTDVDLRETSSHQLHLGRHETSTDPNTARFRLVVGDGAYLAAREEMGDLPLVTALMQNRPNPFNPATLIPFSLAKPGRVQLSIHDLRGARVALLTDDRFDAGRYEQLWRGEDDAGRPVAAGVYFVRLRTEDGGGYTRKLTLMK